MAGRTDPNILRNSQYAVPMYSPAEAVSAWWMRLASSFEICVYSYYLRWFVCLKFAMKISENAISSPLSSLKYRFIDVSAKRAVSAVHPSCPWKGWCWTYVMMGDLCAEFGTLVLPNARIRCPLLLNFLTSLYGAVPLRLPHKETASLCRRWIE